MNPTHTIVENSHHYKGVIHTWGECQANETILCRYIFNNEQIWDFSSLDDFLSAFVDPNRMHSFICNGGAITLEDQPQGDDHLVTVKAYHAEKTMPTFFALYALKDL